MDQEEQKIKHHSDEFREAFVMLTLETEEPIAQTAKDLIWHSDRGSYRALLMQQHGITQRMNPKGNCRDNVVSVSFFHTLKTEQNRSTSSLLIGPPSVKEGFFCIIRAWNTQKNTPKTERTHHQRYQTRVGAKQDVFKYIASFGNNYSLPDDYEMQLKPA